jgi:hypothetical protein
MDHGLKFLLSIDKSSFYYYYYFLLLQLGVHPVAVELTLIQTRKVYNIREQYKTSLWLLQIGARLLWLSVSVLKEIPVSTQLPWSPLRFPLFLWVSYHVGPNRRALKNLLLSRLSWPPRPGHQFMATLTVIFLLFAQRSASTCSLRPRGTFWQLSGPQLPTFWEAPV